MAGCRQRMTEKGGVLGDTPIAPVRGFAPCTPCFQNSRYRFGENNNMPVYEYECKHCGERFDKIQPVTAERITQCQLCGEGPVRRVIHPVGVIFKGSGWYVNDSRQSAKQSGDTGSKGETKASTKNGDTRSSDNSGGSTESGGSGDSGGSEAKAKDSPTSPASDE